LLIRLKPSVAVRFPLGRTSIELGEIDAGNSLAQQPFTVKLPRTFNKSKLRLEVSMSQSEFGGLTRTETYDVTLIKPELAISDKLASDTNGDGQIQQGENFELELTIANQGQLDALGTQVGVSVDDDRVRTNPATSSLGRLAPNFTAEPVRFAFTVPRAVPAGRLPINVKVTHEDFPSVAKTLNYTILSESAERTIITAERKEEPKQRTMANQKPMIVLLNGVSDGKTVFDNAFKLRATVTDDRGLEAVQVTLNGVREYDAQTNADAQRQLLDSKGRSLTFEQGLLLREGRNEIKIVSRDSNNEQVEKNIIVTYERVSATSFVIDNPDEIDVKIPKTNMDKPDAIAVVIGNKDYLHFPKVDYAIRDARAVCNYLVEMLGYKRHNIILVENATTGRFYELFGMIGEPKGELYNRVRPSKSDVFIYYSGHGLPSPKGAKHGYLVPVDCSERNYRFSGYSMNTFYENVKQIPAKSLTVVFDACFSGKAASGASLITKVSGGAGELTSPFYEKADNPLSRNNALIFASSNGEQFSNWHKGKRHGLFTYFFLKGLRGEADLNGDNSILGSELELYLCDESEGVPHYAGIAGKPQTPVVMGDKGRALVVLK